MVLRTKPKVVEVSVKRAARHARHARAGTRSRRRVEDEDEDASPIVDDERRMGGVPAARPALRRRQILRECMKSRIHAHRKRAESGCG